MFLLVQTTPPLVIKNIPKGVEKRLNCLSSDKQCFDKSKNIYQDSIAKAGHVYEFKYEQSDNVSDLNRLQTILDKPNYTNINHHNRKQRKRNIIWFNPPYSDYVQTNVGKRFLEAIDECFGHNPELKKLSNRHNTKISYKCGPNLKQNINSYNKKNL